MRLPRQKRREPPNVWPFFHLCFSSIASENLFRGYPDHMEPFGEERMELEFLSNCPPCRQIWETENKKLEACKNFGCMSEMLI